MKGLYIFLGIILLLVLVGGCGYNGMNGSRVEVDHKWADVQSQYQRRADLIPNLVEVVKGVADFEKTTLTAVIQAIKFSGLATQKILAQTKSEHDTQYEITINTDSSYVLNSGTKWVYGWKKNNWKTKAKDDVLNKDLWQMFLDESSGLKLSWNLIKGHSGVPGNVRCDEIATTYADNKEPTLYSGSLHDYGVDVSHVPPSVPQKKKSKTSSSKTKA